jgi:hypothetical protein
MLVMIICSSLSVPALGITKEHNLASPKIYNPPSSQQQMTCPDGSTPDANGKCRTNSSTITNQTAIPAATIPRFSAGSQFKQAVRGGGSGG